MRETIKGKRFEELLERADTALSEKYYVESITLYYAFIEERMISLFNRLGYTLNKKQKLWYCIDQLKKLKIETFFSSTLLHELDVWREERNDVIHDYAKEDIPYSNLEKTAETGKRLGRDLSAAIMRHKKSLK